MVGGGERVGAATWGSCPPYSWSKLFRNRGRMTKEKLHKWAFVSYLAGRVQESFFSFFKKINLLINLFLAALGLCCCMRAFSSCSDRGLLFIAVLGLFIAVASLVVEHGP